MAVEVSIKVDKDTTMPELILPGVHYGIMDDVFRLDEGKLGNVTVVYDPKNICRGLELSLSDEADGRRAEVRLSLPCGWRDVHFFYGYIWEICKKFNTQSFLRDEEPAELEQIDSFIFSDIKTSEKVLRQMEDNISSGKYVNISLSGAMNPVALDLPILQQIDGDTKNLDEFMHRLQSQDVYYARPSVYQRKDGSLFGIYTLTDNVVSVLPKEPKLQVPNDLPNVEDWNVGLVFDNKMGGAVAYQDFLAFVGDDRPAYDAANFIVSLTSAEMKELLLQARVQL